MWEAILHQVWTGEAKSVAREALILWAGILAEIHYISFLHTIPPSYYSG
jgi:hypothetical protein